MIRQSIIIDTDFGGDPDDIFALTYALYSPEVNILAIITSDEYKTNHRASLIHRWLNTKKVNIPVFSGKDLGNNEYFLLDQYVLPQKISSIFESDKIETYLQQLAKEHGYYIAIGGLSNLSYFIKKYPDYFRNIQIIVMGGAINYIRPGVAEHNIRLDIEAANDIFQSKLDVKWVLSDRTFSEELKISPNHKIFALVSKHKDFFHLLLKQNMQLFYDNKYPASYLHDPVTISSVFMPSIIFKDEKISLNTNGEFILSEQGRNCKVSEKVNTSIFWNDFYSKILESCK